MEELLAEEVAALRTPDSCDSNSAMGSTASREAKDDGDSDESKDGGGFGLWTLALLLALAAAALPVTFRLA
jgi:hypothetical protein